MTIEANLKFGTEGMTATEKQAEALRRVKVIEKVNALGEKISRIDVQLKILPAEYGCCKTWKRMRKGYQRQINRIKASESAWLREAAWFLY